MKNLSNFFPETVYFCDCLQMVIEKCKKPCSLQDLCNEINNNDSDGEIIYCAKCGNEKKDVVFSCTNHMTMGTFFVQYTADNATVMQIQDTILFIVYQKIFTRKIL